MAANKSISLELMACHLSLSLLVLLRPHHRHTGNIVAAIIIHPQTFLAAGCISSDYLVSHSLSQSHCQPIIGLSFSIF